MINNIINDSFRMDSVSRTIDMLVNTYLILCDSSLISNSRSTIPDISEMKLGIKSTEKKYAILKSTVGTISGLSEITSPQGNIYYVTDDITGLEQYLWNALYLKFKVVSGLEEDTYSGNTVLIAANFNDYDGNVISEDLMIGDRFIPGLTAMDFSYDDVILSITQVPVITIDLSTDNGREFEVIINF